MINALIMALLLAIPCFFLYQVEPRGDRLEEQVRDRIPFSQSLRQLGLDLRLLNGQREQNQIFISGERLMRNIGVPNEACVEENTEAVTAFAARLAEDSDGKKHVYLAVLPTAAGVLRQDLPRFAESGLVDQRRKIEEIYNQLAVGVRTVDAYSALHSHREETIYYRTDNSLTALGGYYAYTAIARRLDRPPYPMSQFDVEYAAGDYYGNLYRPQSGREGGSATAPYRKVRPDVLALYRYNGGREYTVTQERDGESKVYHTLYPRHRMELDSPMDVYLGGPAPVTRIQSTSVYGGRLLVLGDDTAAAYLPFLANHYYQATLVNLLEAGRDEIAAIRPGQYDQILFVYSIETYIHSTAPARVGLVEWSD